MPAETTNTTAAPVAAAAAPAAAAPPAAPAAAPSASEMEMLRREALNANKQLRARDADMTQMRAELERIKASEVETESLKSKNFSAWMEKRLGMNKADLTRSLMAAKGRLDPAEEAKMQVAELRKSITERDQREAAERARQEQLHDEGVTTRAFQMLRDTIVKDADDNFEILKLEMDNNPKGWARAIRDYADKFPQKTAREVAADLSAAALARIEKMIQNPAVARALKLGQPQSPAAPTGSETPKTISSRLTGEVSGKTKLPVAEANKTRINNAIRAWEAAEATKPKGA